MMYDVIQNGFWLDSFANIFSIIKTLKKLMLRTLKRGKNKKRRNDFTSMSTAHKKVCTHQHYQWYLRIIQKCTSHP